MPIANLITNNKIILSIQHNATSNLPNAITAGFDCYSYVFYYITNCNLARNSILVPNATATNF